MCAYYIFNPLGNWSFGFLIPKTKSFVKKILRNYTTVIICPQIPWTQPMTLNNIFNRPGVAGAVLQTAS